MLGRPASTGASTATSTSRSWRLPDAELRVIATVGCVVVMLAFQLVFLYNFIISMRRGKKAEANPWKANTLEWTVPRRRRTATSRTFPTVYRGPYEYSVPGP